MILEKSLCFSGDTTWMAGRRQEKQLLRHMQLEARSVPSSASQCSRAAARSAFQLVCTPIGPSTMTGDGNLSSARCQWGLRDPLPLPGLRFSTVFACEHSSADVQNRSLAV